MSETHAARIAELEAQLRTVTDRIGGLMDQINQKGFVPVFRCGHSKLYFPGDYLKEYGRLYGIGCGPVPVSEVLDTDYETAPPEVTPDIRRIEQIMHPVMVSCAQVDFLLVAPAELEAARAVLAIDDPDMDIRAGIVRARQLKNPRGRIRVLQARFEGGR